MVADPDSRIAADYRHIARRVSAQLSLRESATTGSAFPNIVVDDGSSG